MRIIAEKKWPGGLALEIIDYSRPVAADRWYVKVVGNIGLPVRPEYYAGMDSGEAELDDLMRQKLGDRLEYQLVRERNFIDENYKDELVAQLTAQLLEIVSLYLDEEIFPTRLFATKHRELYDHCVVERGRARRLKEDDDEPVDFSHCFK